MSSQLKLLITKVVFYRVMLVLLVVKLLLILMVAGVLMVVEHFLGKILARLIDLQLMPLDGLLSHL